MWLSTFLEIFIPSHEPIHCIEIDNWTPRSGQLNQSKQSTISLLERNFSAYCSRHLATLHDGHQKLSQKVWKIHDQLGWFDQFVLTVYCKPQYQTLTSLSVRVNKQKTDINFTAWKFLEGTLNVSCFKCIILKNRFVLLSPIIMEISWYWWQNFIGPPSDIYQVEILIYQLNSRQQSCATTQWQWCWISLYH